jgi:hypothetical protein
MTPEEKQTLRRAAEDAESAVFARSNLSFNRNADWKLQTSNSFRRIGCHGDGDVLCGTKHPIDGHPDLLASAAVLDYIVAAQPQAVLALLDDIELRLSGIPSVLAMLSSAFDQLMRAPDDPLAVIRARTLIEHSTVLLKKLQQ